MENTTHYFRETNLVLQLMQESEIKRKTVIVGDLESKKKAFVVPFILPKETL